MSKEPKGPLFTIAYDEIIRAPDITDTEFRLYMVMLSYCTKKGRDAPKVCRLTQEAMAGIMRTTERSVRRLLRSLEAKKLVKTDGTSSQGYPIYSVVTSPPENICPDELRASRTRDAVDYVRAKGGVKALQRKKRAARKHPVKNTGRPKSTQGDGLGDDLGPQPPENTSLSDSPTGHPCPGQPDNQVQATGHPCPGARTPLSGSTGHRCLPGTDVLAESSSERPNGLCDPTTESSSRKTPGTPRTSVANDEDGCTVFDIRNDPEENVASETPAQRQERLDRMKALRGGGRSKINDVSKADESHEPSPSGASSAKFKRGAGRPIARDETTAFVEKYLSEIPSSPWSLYGHFCAVVRSKFPGAKLPKAGNGKYLRWGKMLLKQYSPEDLYEMSRVHVLDFDNIKKSKIFFKYGGTPTPTFEQFFANAEVLATYIGKGVIALPAARVSAYMDDYRKRKGIKNDISNEEDDQGRTDPFDALRQQLPD